jgi:hypothetical protein
MSKYRGHEAYIDQSERKRKIRQVIKRNGSSSPITRIQSLVAGLDALPLYRGMVNHIFLPNSSPTANIGNIMRHGNHVQHLRDSTGVATGS